ncbi:hypothetical protein BGZ72_007655 [Mortierella alpina]|nr:hypothetical protein BGZ72_007655 [Mortierella alpina]
MDGTDPDEQRQPQESTSSKAKGNRSYQQPAFLNIPNKLIRPMAWPIPDAHVEINKLQCCKWLSFWDCKDGYLQSPTEEQRRYLTAVAFPEGLWEYNVLPMGLIDSMQWLNELLANFRLSDEEDEDFVVGGVDNPTKDDLQNLLSRYQGRLKRRAKMVGVIHARFNDTVSQIRQIRLERSVLEDAVKVTVMKEDMLAVLTQQCKSLRRDMDSLKLSILQGYNEDVESSVEQGSPAEDTLPINFSVKWNKNGPEHCALHRVFGEEYTGQGDSTQSPGRPTHVDHFDRQLDVKPDMPRFGKGGKHHTTSPRIFLRRFKAYMKAFLSPGTFDKLGHRYMTMLTVDEYVKNDLLQEFEATTNVLTFDECSKVFLCKVLTEEQRLVAIMNLAKQGKKRKETYQRYASRLTTAFSSYGVEDNNNAVLNQFLRSIKQNERNHMVTRLMNRKGTGTFSGLQEFADELKLLADPVPGVDVSSDDTPMSDSSDDDWDDIDKLQANRKRKAKEHGALVRIGVKGSIPVFQGTHTVDYERLVLPSFKDGPVLEHTSKLKTAKRETD